MARKKTKKVKMVNVGPQKVRFRLPEGTDRIVWAILMFLVALIITLSFFKLAGSAGEIFMRLSLFLFGKTTFVIPLLLSFLGIMLFGTNKRHFLFPTLVVSLLLTLGIDGILGALGIFNASEKTEMGGWVGYLLSFFPMKFFGIWVSLAIFSATILVGLVIGFKLIERPKPISEKVEPSVLKKIFTPKFKLKEISQAPEERESTGVPLQPIVSNVAEKKSPIPFQVKEFFGPQKESEKKLSLKSRQYPSYTLPPTELLEADRGQAQSGDIKVNSAIIKRTLENFDIPVEISEVNVGPTVTQYALKPAEGIKLSKITALANDLALALASHPIRIEAPIPGKPLVGIEVPNRVRAQVRLRSLLEDPVFQNVSSHLTISLGRDVAGNPVFADLARMPHLLVAGATGAGKTIGLNAIILSLLYQNSPDILRFILVDPKRVEFPVYNDLPHLLTPVIFDAQKTVYALKWLIGEMERRFGVLSLFKARDIVGFNQLALKEGQELMPYIVLIIDELADLMAAKGREVEAGIVRLAQMARAVGIHLIVATQRPSVEVITGLIKANVTSRIAFQVASQVDSRTILDMAGAEKLLGLGDMLFVSAEISKPKRIQGAYVSEKEVRRVVKFIRDQVSEAGRLEGLEMPSEKLAEDLEKSLQLNKGEEFEYFGEEDPLYEEAKKLVIETRKASASFLQRRLRLGYARAARLIDMLEERGVVGPGEGAKPREVLIGFDKESKEGKDEGEEWKKV